MNDFLVTGYDMFPLLRTLERGDGSSVEYEMWHARVHLLSWRGEHLTCLFGAPGAMGPAHDIWDRVQEQIQVGEGIQRCDTPSKPKLFDGKAPRKEAQTLTGYVVGHTASYSRDEKRLWRRYGPQLQAFLTVIVKRDDGTHGYEYVRLHKRCRMKKEDNVVEAIAQKWAYMRRCWNTGDEIKAANAGGIWLLEGELPEDKPPVVEPASMEDVERLSAVWLGQSSDETRAQAK